jgi:hypothetical protein
MYSLKRNQPGVPPQAVTTVWRTELGTTLLIGFNSTTDVSAYFRSWVFPVSLKPPHRAKFLTSMARHAGIPLLRELPRTVRKPDLVEFAETRGSRAGRDNELTRGRESEIHSGSC